MQKPILDVCCGSRMFYFDKNNPNVCFMDSREVKDTLCDGRKLEIKPLSVGGYIVKKMIEAQEVDNAKTNFRCLLWKSDVLL